MAACNPGPSCNHRDRLTLRILHAGNASDAPVLHRFGGAQQRRIRELAFAQARRGHEVIVYSFGTSHGELVQHGVRFRTLSCRLPHPWRQQEFVARIAGHLRRCGERVDVAHFHSQVEGSLLPGSLALVRVLSFDFVRMRGGTGRPWSPIIGRLLARFDRLLPVSDACALAARDYWGLADSSLRVLPNGVNLEEFRPHPAGHEWRYTRGLGAPLVLYVGRLCEQKGTEVLAVMAPLLRRLVPEAEIVAIGPEERFGNTAPVGKWPQRLAAAGIRWLGALDDEELPVAYSAAELFVMPTIADEMFGMAVVEAEASGTPVVASDLGGLRETVPPEAGRRVAVGDAAGFAKTIAGLLVDPALRQELGAGARRHAARYAWSRIAEQSERIYAEQLDARSATS